MHRLYNAATARFEFKACSSASGGHARQISAVRDSARLLTDACYTLHCRSRDLWVAHISNLSSVPAPPVDEQPKC
jgi:hypothetical protein